MEDADANGEDGVDSGSGEGSGDVGKILLQFKIHLLVVTKQVKEYKM